MAGNAEDLQGIAPPQTDGQVTRVVNREAAFTMREGQRVPNPFFDTNRTVLFVNGMLNSGASLIQSALQLSLIQMCEVIAVYNQSTGFWGDLVQCVGDKNQFNGASLSARNGTAVRSLLRGETSVQAARETLSRNACQVALFDLLLPASTRRWELFAHSQGNLILSNVLQAIEAVQGSAGIVGRVVQTYGSPSANWPKGIVKYEHGFTFDGVNWLSGIDWSFTISKVGIPRDSWNPLTHAFLEYMKLDPEFIVNRFRTGGWGMTFNMDEDGLARCLVAMGTNMPRVKAVFRHLQKNHGSDSDDVAVRYIQLIRLQPQIVGALRQDRELTSLLQAILGSGVTFPDERRAMEFLRGL